MSHFKLKYHPFPQNPKFQEPVTLDFLDAELENDIKVEVECVDNSPYTYTYTLLSKGTEVDVHQAGTQEPDGLYLLIKPS